MKAFIEKIPLQRAGATEDCADADHIAGRTLNVDGGFEMN